MNTLRIVSFFFFVSARVSAFNRISSTGHTKGRAVIKNVSRQRLSPQYSQVQLSEPEPLVENAFDTQKVNFKVEEINNNLEQIFDVPSKVRKGTAPEFAIAGDSTVETPAQVAVVAAHFGIASLNLGLATSSIPLGSLLDFIPILFTVALSVILGDFGTGVFHWATDNYGSLKTPIFGSVCAAFQGHHVTPWTITFRSFANNVYKICYATVPVLLLVAAVPMGALSKIFLTLFATWWMISQELHKFSHMRTTPKAIKVFQDLGIILSKKEHGLHHTSPFEGHYCILTGVCNSFLDDSKFFRHLENIVFRLTGNKPNTWLADPELEKKTQSM